MEMQVKQYMRQFHSVHLVDIITHTHTHTHTYTTILWPSWILSDKTRKVKPNWIYWSKR